MRPYKHAVSNLVYFITEAMLLVVYLECMGFTEKYTDKSSYCKVGLL
jgi:hypothetical protein